MTSHAAHGALVTAFIALGSNLESPERQVLDGLGELGAMSNTRLLASSSLYRSAPVGYRDQPDFINAVACIETGLSPRALLDALLAIERERGRVRTHLNAPRTLDLDIALYGDLVIREAGLTIPHPRMHERAFVVIPLAEIAPECMVPGLGRARDLLAAMDATSVTRLTEMDCRT